MSEPTFYSKRKRMLKRVGCAAILLFLLAAGAVWLFSDSLLRTTVEQVASRNLGLPVHIGTLRLSIIGRPRLILTDVSIKGESELFRLKQVSLGLHGIPGIIGSATVITIDAADMNIHLPQTSSPDFLVLKESLARIMASSDKESSPWAIPSFILRGAKINWQTSTGAEASLSIGNLEGSNFASPLLEKEYDDPEIELGKLALEVGNSRHHLTLGPLSGRFGISEEKIFLRHGKLEEFTLNDSLISDGGTFLNAAINDLSRQTSDLLPASDDSPPKAVNFPEVHIKDFHLGKISVLVDDRHQNEEDSLSANLELESFNLGELLFASGELNIAGAAWQKPSITLAAGKRRLSWSCDTFEISDLTASKDTTLPKISATCAAPTLRLEGPGHPPLSLSRQKKDSHSSANFTLTESTRPEALKIERLSLENLQLNLPLKRHDYPPALADGNLILSAWRQAFATDSNELEIASETAEASSLAVTDIEVVELGLNNIAFQAVDADSKKDAFSLAATVGAFSLRGGNFQVGSGNDSGLSASSLSGTELAMTISDSGQELLSSGLVTGSIHNLKVAAEDAFPSGEFNTRGLRLIAGSPKPMFVCDNFSVASVAGGNLPVLRQLSLEKPHLALTISHPGEIAEMENIKLALTALLAYLPGDEHTDAPENAAADGSAGQAIPVLESAGITGLQFTINDHTIPDNDHILTAHMEKLAGTATGGVRLDGISLDVQNQGKSGISGRVGSIMIPDLMAVLMPNSIMPGTVVIKDIMLRPRRPDMPEYLAVEKIGATLAGKSPLHLTEALVQAPRLTVTHSDREGWDVSSSLAIAMQPIESLFAGIAEEAATPSATGPDMDSLNAMPVKTAANAPTLRIDNLRISREEHRLRAVVREQITEMKMTREAAHLNNVLLYADGRVTVAEGSNTNTVLSLTSPGQRTLSAQAGIINLANLDSAALEAATANLGLTLRDIAITLRQPQAHAPETLLTGNEISATISNASSALIVLPILSVQDFQLFSKMRRDGTCDILEAIELLDESLASFGTVAGENGGDTGGEKTVKANMEKPFAIWVKQIALENTGWTVQDFWATQSETPIQYRLRDFWLRGRDLAYGSSDKTPPKGILTGAGRFDNPEKGSEDGSISIALWDMNLTDPQRGTLSTDGDLAALLRQFPDIVAEVTGTESSSPKRPLPLKGGVRLNAILAGLLNPLAAMGGMQFRDGEGTVSATLRGGASGGKLDMPLDVGLYNIKPLRISKPKKSLPEWIINAISGLLNHFKTQHTLEIKNVGALVGTVTEPEFRDHPDVILTALAAGMMGNSSDTMKAIGEAGGVEGVKEKLKAGDFGAIQDILKRRRELKEEEKNPANSAGETTKAEPYDDEVPELPSTKTPTETTNEQTVKPTTEPEKELTREERIREALGGLLKKNTDDKDTPEGGKDDKQKAVEDILDIFRK